MFNKEIEMLQEQIKIMNWHLNRIANALEKEKVPRTPPKEK